jgi:hypothetical protein
VSYVRVVVVCAVIRVATIVMVVLALSSLSALSRAVLLYLEGEDSQTFLLKRNKKRV